MCFFVSFLTSYCPRLEFFIKRLAFCYVTLMNSFKAIEKQWHTSKSNHRVMIHDASQCISPLPQTPTQLSSTVHSEISLSPCSLSPCLLPQGLSGFAVRGAETPKPITIRYDFCPCSAFHYFVDTVLTGGIFIYFHV